MGIIRYYRLQEDLDRRHLSSVCSNIAVIVDAISANRTSNSKIFNSILDFDFDNAVVVGSVLTTLCRLFMKMDGAHGFRSLYQADELFSIGVDPSITICTL